MGHTVRTSRKQTRMFRPCTSSASFTPHSLSDARDTVRESLLKWRCCCIRRPLALSVASSQTDLGRALTIGPSSKLPGATFTGHLPQSGSHQASFTLAAVPTGMSGHSLGRLVKCHSKAYVTGCSIALSPKRPTDRRGCSRKQAP